MEDCFCWNLATLSCANFMVTAHSAPLARPLADGKGISPERLGADESAARSQAGTGSKIAKICFFV